MAAIYIHIPFCKQACHYCDFHFSTSLKKKPELIQALQKELVLRKGELRDQIESIYFGGGTPSLLSSEELEAILNIITEHYWVSKDAEITLEANPDDLSEQHITQLATSGVNRLSIGIQSFFEEDLKMMNRAHNSSEALDSVQTALQYFDNISIDLIYGIPGMSNRRWHENLEMALELQVPHISSYALTVEDRTALHQMIARGEISPVAEETAREHYEIMIHKLEEAGFINYEFSNFGRPGFYSRNNMGYWTGKPYVGIGPSAHSFDGKIRKWNVRNNHLYLKALQRNELPAESETLSPRDRYNEMVMTRLRTKNGISVVEVEKNFGGEFLDYLSKEGDKLISKGLLEWHEKHLRVTRAGKFLSDGIAAELFLVDLDENKP